MILAAAWTVNKIAPVGFRTLTYRLRVARLYHAYLYAFGFKYLHVFVTAVLFAAYGEFLAELTAVQSD